MPIHPAIFLDRDGTLVEDRGCLRTPRELELFPDTVPALLRLQRHFRLFIVTNQPWIARGEVAAEDVARLHAALCARLAAAGVRIEEVCTCPHRRDDGCECIKPKPRLVHQAAAAHGIDLARSWVVGDHPHDVELATTAGCAGGIYLLTGHGEHHLAELPAEVTVMPGIRAAAEWILDVSLFERWRMHRGAELETAARRLAGGGVVAFATETVYGLGANAWDAQAVARVFEIKRRPAFDPLIVHVAAADWLGDLVSEMPEFAMELIRRFWPGPLTLVLPKRSRVPDIVTAGLPTVAVRMPRHPVALELIRRAGVPVAAPSANPFGRVSPTLAEHVRRQLGEAVDMVLDGGPCRVGVESTVVSLADDQPVLLRAGGLPVEEIERVIGSVRRSDPAPDRPVTPGQFPQHYSPQTPLVLRTQAAPLSKQARAGLLSFRAPAAPERFAAVEVLSPSGDLREAAANLFAALHRLDTMELDLIVADPVPDAGLGLAINDRLRRAACPKDETHRSN